MPFDVALLSIYDQPENLDERLIRRRQLIELLKAPPAQINGENFRWNFCDIFQTDMEDEDGWCGSVGCAVGVAHLMWPDSFNVESYDIAVEMAEFLGLTKQQAETTFLTGYPYPRFMGEVTPQMVAEELAKFGDEIFEDEPEEEDEDEIPY